MGSPHATSGTHEWPELRLADWQDTYATLHRYAQVVGKVQLKLARPVNHWWHVGFEVTSRGLRTQTLPYGDGEAFEISFDFIEHELSLTTSRGDHKLFALEARPVAEFYRDLMATLGNVGINVSIWDVPVEIPNETLPFHEDREHRTYEPAAAERYFRVLLRAHEALSTYRGRFTGKSSPVLFYWGAFDLAVSRFSGRPAPEREGQGEMMQEAMCEEEISVGFWPGHRGSSDAIFYGYCAPAPAGFTSAKVRPKAAFYDEKLSEFVLPYEELRREKRPREALLEFCESVYEAGASRAGWDRERLERPLKIRPGAQPAP